MSEKAAIDCEALEELIPAFALGATDPDEAAFVRAHLANCPEAAAALAEYSALADAMLFSAPPVQAPLGLGAKLQAATATPQVSSQPSATGSSIWQRLWAALSAPNWAPVFALGATALLLVVVLAAAGLYWRGQLGQVRADQAAIAQRLANHNDFLATIAEDEPWRVMLPPGPAGEESGAYATMICNPEAAVGLVYAEDLPPLAPDMGYQMWLDKDGEHTSVGMLELDGQGNGTLVFRAPQPVGEFESIGITAEPAGGSPNPSSPAVIQGSIYGQDYQPS